MNKTLLLFCLTFSFSILLVSDVFAECKCLKAKSIDVSYKESNLVFVGQVVSVEDASVLRQGYRLVRLMVTAPYKGSELLPETEYVTIFTPIGDCGIEFVKQNDYLILAKGQPAFYTTSSCELSDILETSMDKQMRVAQLSNQR